MSDLLQCALNDVRIAPLVTPGQDFADEIRAAVDRLVKHEGADESNLVPAALKAARAIKGSISLFISYKLQDRAIADRFVAILRELGAQKFKDVFWAHDSESNPPGGDFRKKIDAALDRSHLFVLLLPEVSKDRTWLMYEAGYFRRAKLPGDRIVCVRHPALDRPSQLEQFQMVESVQHIYDFLDSLLRKDNAIPGMQAINPHIRDDRLRDAANEIDRLLCPSAASFVWKDYCPSLELEIDSQPFLSGAQGIERAKIASARELDSVFGIVSAEATCLGELLKNAPDADQGKAWVAELASVIRDVLENKVPRPLQAVFSGFSAGTAYHPHFVAASRRSSGTTYSVRVLFTEALAGRINHVPEVLEAYHTSVRLTYRVRWEILENFKGRLSAQDVDSVERVLKRVEAEAASRGCMDRELLLRAYSPKAQAQISELFEKWAKLRNGDTGVLDRAFATKDAKLLRSGLDTLELLNAVYMRLAAQHAGTIVARYWPEVDEGEPLAA